jgi:hypothetical protein
VGTTELTIKKSHPRVRRRRGQNKLVACGKMTQEKKPVLRNEKQQDTTDTFQQTTGAEIVVVAVGSRSNVKAEARRENNGNH